MGCILGTKGAVWKTKLAEVNGRCMKKSWRKGGQLPDIAELSRVVRDLEQCHGYFESEGTDRESLGIIQNLANGLVEELHSLLEPRHMRQHRDSLEKMVRLSKQLNNFRANKSELVAQKFQGLLAQELRKLLESVDQVMSTCEATRLLSVSRKVLSNLEEAAEILRQVPERQGDFASCCRSWSDLVLAVLPTTIEEQPRDVNGILELTGRVDQLRSCVNKSQQWEPLAPRAKKLRDEVALEVAAQKLKDLEAVVAGDMNMSLAIQLLDEFTELSGSNPEEAQRERIRGCISKLVETIQSAFEQAIAIGDTTGMETLLKCAKELDQKQQKHMGAEAAFIARSLEQKKAGVTLKSILPNAERNVSKQSEELHKLYLDAQAAFKKMDPEQLEQPATGARWRFRLGSGKFRDYSAEKMREVEELYQKWCKKGKPANKQDCRYEISIQVKGPGVPTKSSATGLGVRERCPYGEKCYRKNPEHRKEMSHPGDADWAVPNPESEEVRTETYSLDFHLMTQVNLTRGGRAMRIIKRDEGMTWAEKLTHVYTEKVTEFVKDAEDTFSQAEVELHLLGGSEREAMQQQADALVHAMRPALVEFLQLAVATNNKKAIEQVVALLGTHAEALRLKDAIKEVRLSDVLRELKQAHAPLKASGPRRWELLQMLCKPQKASRELPQLLPCRLALVKAKRERSKLATRRAGMRCQALLSEYEEDKEFCSKIRQEITKVLKETLGNAAESLDVEVVQSTLRVAAPLQCDMDELLAPAGHLLVRLLTSAASSRQPIARVGEVMDGAEGLAKAVQRPFEEILKLMRSFGDMQSLMALSSQKCFREIKENQGSGEPLPLLVKRVVEVRLKMRAKDLMEGFDDTLWQTFQPWYRELQAGPLGPRTAAAEFAIAYTEQLKIPLPKWLLDKDQVEALRKLEAALATGQERALREAVVFAKQTDHKADEALCSKYEEALTRLKKLKRLPSGWEVTDLVGDDASTKMFKKADLDDPKLKQLFQQLFDDTKASIVTRDRAARGAGDMPRGYRVQKVVSVMNAESWQSYAERRDHIAEDCRRYPGCAPLSETAWAEWSGKVHTAPHGDAILEGAHLPSLNAGANEFLMFHGTKPEAADLIAIEHFDMAFACKTGLFGAGLYFAENSSKSDEYVKGDAKGWYPMILCRVTLGRIYYCANADPTTDPGRDKLEDACTSGTYHCVLGDRFKARGTYREYVLYDHYQVYPQFIVWYTRV